MQQSPTNLIQEIHKFVGELPNEEERTNFYSGLCTAIQRRKDYIIKVNGFDPFPNTIQNTSIRYQIAEKVSKSLLGGEFALQWDRISENTVESELSVQAVITDSDSTEAALERVEALKHKYSPEQIVEMRRLRAEVGEIISKIVTIDNDRSEKLIDEVRQIMKQQVLQSHGITKFQGRKVHDDPICFILDEDPKTKEVTRNNGYRRFIMDNAIFKMDVRKLDNDLAVAIRNALTRNKKTADPLLTEDEYTEMVAAGIFGSAIEQKRAIGYITTRELNRTRMQVVLRTT